jgi:pyruvate dehydrogenase E2 component (dihydrolipoamide acetyltransferase)
MTTFNLPDLGEGLAEAEIVRWHVNVGDVVTVDQPMLAVETAKAVVEVPAPFSGIVKTLHGQPGDVIATGAPLIDFESVRGTAAARNSSADTGTVVGNMPTSDTELIETAHAGSSTYNRTNGGPTLPPAPTPQAAAYAQPPPHARSPNGWASISLGSTAPAAAASS